MVFGTGVTIYSSRRILRLKGKQAGQTWEVYLSL